MLRAIVDSWAFQASVFIVVVIAAVLVGLETYPALVAQYGPLLHVLNALVVLVFAAEAILKMGAHGRRFYRYFKDPWNVFDFSIVVVCLLPASTQYAAVLRLVRVVRALRVVTALPRLQLLVGSLLRSLPSMGYIGLLLLILFYVYAVTGVFLWRDNDPVHFGDLPTAFLSLFRVVTLEDWTDLMYIQMHGSDEYPFEMRGVIPPRSSAAPILSPIYFVSFVLLGTMIVLNLFIGVILNSMTEAQRDGEVRQRMRRLAKKGHTSLADDVAELDKKLDEIRDMLDALRDRIERPKSDGG